MKTHIPTLEANPAYLFSRFCCQLPSQLTPLKGVDFSQTYISISLPCCWLAVATDDCPPHAADLIGLGTRLSLPRACRPWQTRQQVGRLPERGLWAGGREAVFSCSLAVLHASGWHGGAIHQAQAAPSLTSSAAFLTFPYTG